MKIYISILVFILGGLVIGCKTASKAPTKSGFVPDYNTIGYEKALAKAKKLNQPIFLDFYFDACFPCKVFDKEILNKPATVKYLKDNFVTMKVDVMKTEGSNMSDQFLMSIYPSVLFLSPKGDIIETHEGMPSHTEFFKMGDNAIKVVNAAQ